MRDGYYVRGSKISEGEGERVVREFRIKMMEAVPRGRKKKEEGTMCCFCIILLLISGSGVDKYCPATIFLVPNFPYSDLNRIGIIR